MSSVDRALSSIRVVSSRRWKAPRSPVASEGAPPQLLVIPERDDLRIDTGGRHHLVRSDQLAVVCPAEGDTITLTREIRAEMHTVVGVEAIAFESRGHVYTLLEQELPRTIVVDRTPLLVSVVALLQAEGRRDPVVNSLLCKLTEVAVCAAIAAWIDTAPTPPGWIGGVAHPTIGATLEAVHSELGAAWTVSDMAAHAHMSRSAFARLFREVVGSTPSSHLARWRMAHALELLDAAPELPLKDVAERLGYSDEFALSTAFKRRFGASPRNYVDPAPSRIRS
ncbi:putative response regulatory protein [Microbacterium oxydans]|uniref:Putative response regulatory protein n=1 Tax=Microbacterium oxydans TaxID=82380 RepID=A0A0F0KMT2_9MICO|nr:putative response regulatory protein [Microbacterium oxydans]